MDAHHPGTVPAAAAPGDMDDSDDTVVLRRLADSLVAGARDGAPEGASAAVAAIRRPGRPDAIAAAGTTFLPDLRDLPGIAVAGDRAPLPVDTGTLFDLASVTKVVTTLTALTLAGDSLLDLDAPVREVLGDPVPHPAITPRHLLTHTAGLPSTLPLHRVPGGPAARRDAVRRAQLVTAPGTAHAYSCTGFILLGLLLEHLGGAPLPELARTRVLDPARMHRTAWHLSPADRERAAATEVQTDPPRGLVQGEVHDEAAWGLMRRDDGAAPDPTAGSGNAGLFAPVADVLALGTLLSGTSPTGTVCADGAPGPAIPAALRRELATDQLMPLGITTGEPWRQGLGTRIGQDLPTTAAGARVIGHSGFTGTTVLADLRDGTVAVLLTNRVHPHRDRFSVMAARRALAARAFPA